MKNKLKQKKEEADKNAHIKQEEDKPVKFDNEVVLNQYDFSSLEVDETTMNFLKEKTLQVKSIVNKSFDQLGELFKETQENLSKNGYGCFQQWYEQLGFKKQTVYNYINRHNLIVQRLDKREIIESLPLKLVYVIANPNCPEELKEEALSGKIKSYQELLEYKNKEENKKPEPQVIEYDEILPNVVEDLGRVSSDIRNKYQNLDINKKEQLYKAIEKFEKEIEKLLNN